MWLTSILHQPRQPAFSLNRLICYRFNWKDFAQRWCDLCQWRIENGTEFSREYFRRSWHINQRILYVVRMQTTPQDYWWRESEPSFWLWLWFRWLSIKQYWPHRSIARGAIRSLGKWCDGWCDLYHHEERLRKGKTFNVDYDFGTGSNRTVDGSLTLLRLK